jgi:hypothetical protein
MTEHYAMRRELGAALDCALRAHGGLAAIQLDAHGRIQGVDAVFTIWTGFTAAGFARHRFADLAAAGARREIMSAFERALRDTGPIRADLTLIGKRGDEISGRAAIAPILSDFVARGAQLLWTRAHAIEPSRAKAV